MTATVTATWATNARLELPPTARYCSVAGLSWPSATPDPKIGESWDKNQAPLSGGRARSAPRASIFRYFAVVAWGCGQYAGGGRHHGFPQWPAAWGPQGQAARSSPWLSSTARAKSSVEGAATEGSPGLGHHARRHRSPGPCGCCVHGDHFWDPRDASLASVVGDIPGLPSTANDRRQQQPWNMKRARALKPRATHGNTLVMRHSAVPVACL
jgi:hypothetical protein